MYNTCCVVSCGSRRKDVTLYRFPKSEIGLKKWLCFINCERLNNLNYEELSNQFVCQKHFEKRFLASTSTHVRSRLRVDAYPTLFTESEISSGIPQDVQIVDITQNAVRKDHDYAKKRKHEDHTYCKTDVAGKRQRMETEYDDGITSTSTQQDEGNLVANDVPLASDTKNNPIETPIAREYDVMPSTSSQLQHNEGSLVANSITDSLNEPIETSIAKEDETVAVGAPKLVVKRKRVISKKKKLLPCCAELYDEYVKSRKQLEFHKRAKRAMKFTKEKYFEKLTKNIYPLAKKIIWMQIKESTKGAKGRRYTNEEKLIALSIMKQSPRCYKFLHKIFILPSKSTLNRMIAGLNIEAGINPQIFEAVKQEVFTWDENKRYCSVIFDEVSLEAALSYDKHKDVINGFVELTERTNEFADHALVFLLRGAIHKWQQPLVFYFCKGATSGVQLKKIITDIIVAVSNTGLLPVALVSDQGTAFQSALKDLQEMTRREQILAGEEPDDVIKINGQTLSVIYDPPHLIKGLRNNFLTKNIKYQGKISKWSDIVEVYKNDCNHTHVRLLSKLNDEHVIPEKIKKMKVKNCVKVLSKTMAATLSYTAQFSHLINGSPTLGNTAEIVSFFDDLFDSVNGSSTSRIKNKGKPLRHAVTEKSPNHDFWKEAMTKLNEIKFIDNRGRETSVPSLKNWITTLRSFQRLWQFFKSKNIKIMRPRYFNSDPIENFFGQMRAYNFRNNNPNCYTFISTFRSLLITRFIQFHSTTYNCQEDSGEQLLKLKGIFETSKKNDSYQNVGSPESSDFNSAAGASTSKTASQERLNIHSRAYCTGWVIRKILRQIKCRKCEDNLTSKNENADVNKWIKFREFKSIKQKKLTYPSEYAVRLFSEITGLANGYLEKNPQRVNIVKYLKNIIITRYPCDFLECEQHKIIIREMFSNLTLSLTVFNWCNVINKILKGTDVVRLVNKTLPPMQLKAFNKLKTRLKNKNLQK